MKKIINNFGFSLGTLVIAAFILVSASVVIISNVSRATDNQPVQSGRLITIYDRGMKEVVVTDSATIGEALKQAGVVIEPKDAVEPGLNEKLIASEYTINIYRARPVIIVDGNIRQKIITPYQTAERIAADAGIVVYPEDKTSIDLGDYLSDGAGLKLTIKRAIPVNFTLYGRTNIVRTQAKTIGAMLNEKNIKMTASDRISPNIDTEITENAPIRLWREGKQTITVDEEVMYDIEKIENADQSVGYVEVKSAGVKGSRSVTYEIIIQDGNEVNRTEIASITTVQPVKQVEIVGVRGQYTTPSENENITWDFLISNGFTNVQAAGIMGNLMQEHHFQTSGDGLAQWTGSRRANLYSRPYPNNIYTQLNFLMEELNGGYAGVRDAIKATSSLTDAVRIFQNRFERCGYCMETTRIMYAQNILASHGY